MTDTDLAAMVRLRYEAELLLTEARREVSRLEEQLGNLDGRIRYALSKEHKGDGK